MVFSDSRRRPLSCTPPSTSISTSVSIDEDEPPNQISHQQEPQIVLAKEDDNVEQEERVEEEEEDNEDEDELRQLDIPRRPSLEDQPMRPKALSSPEFMNVYKPAFDEERDWPPLDDIDDEVDHEKNGYEDITDGGSIDSIRRRKSFTRKRLDTDRI